MIFGLAKKLSFRKLFEKSNYSVAKFSNNLIYFNRRVLFVAYGKFEPKVFKGIFQHELILILIFRGFKEKTDFFLI